MSDTRISSDVPSLPRWFLVTLAACAVVGTAAFSYRMAIGEPRWVRFDDEDRAAILNTRTGVVCVLAGSDGKVPVLCLDMPASGQNGKRVHQGRATPPG